MIWAKDNSRGFIRLVEGACLLAIALLFFTVLSSLAFAQGDPLNPSNMPAIDTNCADYPNNVWVTNSLTEVYQTTGSAPGCSSGQKQWAVVYGTQNEIVDFQVHFHDTGSGTTGYQIKVSSLVQTSPNSFTINAPDSTHTDIIPYRESYINVTTTSGVTNSSTPSYLSVMQNGLSATTGKIPDILVPAIDPYFHQTTNAFPVNVTSNQNQSAWVDVHIPSNAPSGYYSGTVTVQTGCKGPYPSTGCATLATLPIIIAVWQWPSAGFMPSTATLQGVHGVSDLVCIGFFGGSGFDSTCGNGWPAPAGSTTTAITLLKEQLSVLYLDHRMQDFQPYDVGSPWTSLDTYFKPLINGTTVSATGAANTILQGAKLNTTGWNNDAGSISASGQAWMTHWNSNGWAGKIMGYLCDEPPNGCAWSSINTDAVTTHAFTPPMPVLVTTGFSRMTPSVQTAACGTTTCLTNSVDWMITNVNDMANSEYNNLTAYHNYQAGTSNLGTAPRRRWFSYTACDSTACGSQTGGPGSIFLETPNYTLDTTPISHRVGPWFDMYSGQTGELYFDEIACWAGQLNCGNGGDPWQGVKYGGTNGDGTLVYPGRTTGNTTGFNNVGVTTPIFLPSMRLKHVRDGIQDYEIMNVLNANGKSVVVSAAIASFMNTTPGGTGVLAWSFNNTQAPVPGAFTSDLPDARQTLGTAMHQLTYNTNTVLLPPTNLNATVQ